MVAAALRQAFIRPRRRGRSTITDTVRRYTRTQFHRRPRFRLGTYIFEIYTCLTGMTCSADLQLEQRWRIVYAPSVATVTSSPQRMVRMPLSNTENQKGRGTVTTARPAREVRFAFVTPYYQEKHHYLERCIASVKRQTIPADHIVVADGFPQDWIDQTSVRHLRLDRVHQDYGNTPRAIGGLIAVAEGYEGIGLLDADCWLEPDHLAHCLEEAKRVGLERCGFVAAARTLRRLDESIIDLADEPATKHVDTSCFLLMPPSFEALSVWALMPREVSAVCDRVFYLALRSRNLIPAFSSKKTVNFTYTYAPLYRSLGEIPPEPVKENPDHTAIAAWIDRLPRDRLEVLNRRIGADLRALYRTGAKATVSGAIEEQH